MPRVRFIDTAFTVGNPSTNGLVHIVPDLVAAGWEVELVANSIEPELEGKVIHRKIPHWRLPFGQAMWLYFLLYHLLRLKEILCREPRPDVIVSTGFLYLPADIATVHFSHVDWWLAQRRQGFRTWEAWQHLILSIPGFVTEWLLLWSPFRVLLMPVSESVAEDMRRYAAPWKRILMVPNMALSDRFRPDYRERVRDQARGEHGFAEDETVFTFASAGHHYRKGFKDAVHVVAGLRERGHKVRMLVVGGYSRSLRRQQSWIIKAYPDYATWMEFTGMVKNPEYHFSAADGLLFPSLSEAFSLVTIESAILGLPLYLTAHHGSEMILQCGRNGKMLPWDVPGMIQMIEVELMNGRVIPRESTIGKALSREAYAQAWLTSLWQEIRNPMR